MSKVLSTDFRKSVAAGKPVPADTAKRSTADYRFDVLDPDFLSSIAYLDREEDQLSSDETSITLCRSALRSLVDYQMGVPAGLLRAADYCMLTYELVNTEPHLFREYVTEEPGFGRLSPQFVRELAEIAHYATDKYGEWSYTKPGFVGAMSPYNHAFAHLVDYLRGKPNDRGHPTNSHLCHAAYNCMIEYWHITRGGRKTPDGRHGPEVVVVTDMTPSAKRAARTKSGEN